MTSAPNWAEQMTAIATAVGAVGLLGAIIAAVFAGQQVREARKGREAQMAAEFFRRWSDEPLAEARRLLDKYPTPQELSDAFRGFVAANAYEAQVLYRELEYFEQLAALEERGAFDFELIRLLLGQRLVERWNLWRPAIEAAFGSGAYPMFERLATKMGRALAQPG